MHAQGHLGFCYAQGKGVEQSLTEALTWHRKAAAQGHEGASANASAARRALKAQRLAQTGARVELHSLVAKPELNGLQGTVVAFVDATGRSAVQLDHGQGRFELKQETLRLVPEPAGEWKPFSSADVEEPSEVEPIAPPNASESEPSLAKDRAEN